MDTERRIDSSPTDPSKGPFNGKSPADIASMGGPLTSPLLEAFLKDPYSLINLALAEFVAVQEDIKKAEENWRIVENLMMEFEKYYIEANFQALYDPSTHAMPPIKVTLTDSTSLFAEKTFFVDQTIANLKARYDAIIANIEARKEKLCTEVNAEFPGAVDRLRHEMDEEISKLDSIIISLEEKHSNTKGKIKLIDQMLATTPDGGTLQYEGKDYTKNGLQTHRAELENEQKETKAEIDQHKAARSEHKAFRDEFCGALANFKFDKKDIEKMQEEHEKIDAKYKGIIDAAKQSGTDEEEIKSLEAERDHKMLQVPAKHIAEKHNLKANPQFIKAFSNLKYKNGNHIAQIIVGEQKEFALMNKKASALRGTIGACNNLHPAANNPAPNNSVHNMRHR